VSNDLASLEIGDDSPVRADREAIDAGVVGNGANSRGPTRADEDERESSVLRASERGTSESGHRSVGSQQRSVEIRRDESSRAQTPTVAAPLGLTSLIPGLF
jgi:hypothetical protein